MTKEEFQSIQNVQIDIMDDIHRVCTEQGYRYYLIGGSALGAVRHNGIIPWDVDIDIAMPRKDYQKFVTEGAKHLRDGLTLHYCETDKDYATVHAIVVLDSSDIRFRGESADSYRFGIFVDILPLDQWPENQTLKLKQQNDLKRIQLLRGMRLGIKYGSTSTFKSFIKNCTKVAMSLVYSIQDLNRKQQQIMQRHNQENEGNEWCSMVSHYAYEKTTFPKNVFGTPRLYNFSGRLFYVPEKVEDYLSQLFGNYMKCPSIESQQKQINSVVYASWIDRDGKKHEIENK